MDVPCPLSLSRALSSLEHPRLSRGKAQMNAFAFVTDDVGVFLSLCMHFPGIKHHEHRSNPLLLKALEFAREGLPVLQFRSIHGGFLTAVWGLRDGVL